MTHEFDFDSAINEMLNTDQDKDQSNLHIWGGECTVNLPAKHGIGGRCQSLALSAEIEMDEQRAWCLLAAGTDGSDGDLNLLLGLCKLLETWLMQVVFPLVKGPLR